MTKKQLDKICAGCKHRDDCHTMCNAYKQYFMEEWRNIRRAAELIKERRDTR